MKLSERERRAWRLTFLILLVGLSIMCLAGEFALKLAPQWSVKANMESNLDPDATFVAYPTVNEIEPVLPEIETPISYQFLTPATNTVVVTATKTFLPGTPSATPETTNTPVPTITRTPSPTATYTRTFTPSPTSTATPTHTYTPTVILPTWTFTPVPTSTRTRTPTPTFTFTPTRTPTRTPTPTPTFTPTPSYTPTPSFTPTFTPTPSNTPTPSDTPLPSDTPTPGTGCTAITGSGSYAVSSSGTWYCFQTDGVNNGAIFTFTVPDLLAADGVSLLWNGKMDSTDLTPCGMQTYAYSFGSGLDAVTIYTVKNNLPADPLWTYIYIANIAPPIASINISVDNPSWSTSGTNCPP